MNSINSANVLEQETLEVVILFSTPFRYQSTSEYDQPPSPRSPASTSGTAESEVRDQFFTPASPNVYHQSEQGGLLSVGSPLSDSVFDSPEHGTPHAPVTQQHGSVNWMMGDGQLTDDELRGRESVESRQHEDTGTPTPTHKLSTTEKPSGLTLGKRNQVS